MADVTFLFADYGVLEDAVNRIQQTQGELNAQLQRMNAVMEGVAEVSNGVFAAGLQAAWQPLFARGNQYTAELEKMYTNLTALRRMIQANDEDMAGFFKA